MRHGHSHMSSLNARHWRVACKDWIRPQAEPFDPLAFAPITKPAPQPKEKSNRGYWEDLVGRIAAGDPSGSADFDSLYRPALELMLADRFGADRARTLLEPMLQRIIDRISSGQLTKVAEMAAEIGQAAAPRLVVREDAPSVSPAVTDAGSHRRAS